MTRMNEEIAVKLGPTSSPLHISPSRMLWSMSRISSVFSGRADVPSCQSLLFSLSVPGQPCHLHSLSLFFLSWLSPLYPFYLQPFPLWGRLDILVGVSLLLSPPRRMLKYPVAVAKRAIIPLSPQLIFFLYAMRNLLLYVFFHPLPLQSPNFPGSDPLFPSSPFPEEIQVQVQFIFVAGFFLSFSWLQQSLCALVCAMVSLGELDQHGAVLFQKASPAASGPDCFWQHFRIYQTRIEFYYMNLFSGFFNVFKFQQLQYLEVRSSTAVLYTV